MRMMRIAKNYRMAIPSIYVAAAFLITIFPPLNEAFYMTLFQGGRHSWGDNNLPPGGGEDATPRLKLRFRHPSQAAPLDW